MSVEIVKEFVHLIGRHHIRIEGENPVAGVHFDLDAEVLEMMVQGRQKALHQVLHDCDVLVQPWQPRHVNVPHFVVLNQSHEKPERHLL